MKDSTDLRQLKRHIWHPDNDLTSFQPSSPQTHFQTGSYHYVDRAGYMEPQGAYIITRMTYLEERDDHY